MPVLRRISYDSLNEHLVGGAHNGELRLLVLSLHLGYFDELYGCVLTAQVASPDSSTGSEGDHVHNGQHHVRINSKRVTHQGDIDVG